jgi:type III secretion protein D
MKEADLLQHFDLDLNDTGWSMRAHLDDAEGARFERILKTFVSDNKITFPVSARVGSAESMLPFKIRQVVSGVNAGIVTADGERFYVGDELNGVRLVAVTDNHLTFMGKRKIEVIW